jgi:hypothetical protein
MTTSKDENSDMKGKLTSTDDEYGFEFWTDVSDSKKALSSVKKLITKEFKVDVNNGASYLEVDLKWKKASDKPSLTVFTPKKKLDTYYDLSDGTENKKIHVKITPKNSEKVEKGTWLFKISGKNITTGDYKLNVYQH